MVFWYSNLTTLDAYYIIYQFKLYNSVAFSIIQRFVQPAPRSILGHFHYHAEKSDTPYRPIAFNKRAGNRIGLRWVALALGLLPVMQKLR